MAEERILFSVEGITESERILHTPGEFAKKHLLYVQEVGTLKSLQSHKSQREKLDSFLFVGVLDGMGTITTGGEVHRMKKGSGQGTAPFYGQAGEGDYRRIRNPEC